MTRSRVQRPLLFTLACAACAVLALSTGLTWPAHAQSSAELTRQTSAGRAHTALPRHILQTLNQAQVPPSALSVLIAPLPDGPAASGAQPRHLSHHAQASVNPASVMKLFTTYAGLSLLGPEHVWRNRVYTDGPVRDGVLQGNLVVRGSGDPKLVVERLQELMVQIRAAGVRDVRGDIVLDRSVFDVRERSEPFDDEPLRPYNVGPDGLLLNFKAVVYTFTPDAASGQVQVRFEPPLAGFSAPTQLPLSQTPCSDWRRQLQADFSQPQQVRFAGRYPASCGEREWPVAYPEPEAYAPRVMQAMWQGAGGQLTGQVRYGSRPASAKLLLEAPSLPLSEIIKDINKFSNNVMAQQLYLTLSSELGAPGRFEASRLRLSQWWRKGFAGQDEPVLDNGSGLSRTERSTALALTALLQAAHAGPHARHFVDSLAIAGVDGTAARLKDRSPQSPVIGNAWLKTGSLRDVASVAGYVQGQSGQRYTLVAVLHHPNAHQARAALDQLLEWTVRDTASGPAQAHAPNTAQRSRPR
ncbi:D-alanyl-D-alanine carboxypeptidase/D-alanyl-D-alanine-endopeptidase [Limnohabitans sp.]|uniref:D-alanyl-D-alanine carboxypeptidase/D-alanyl-D-alanine endopeptidase n=1 Tax=Limnohabitans sp. TaxID=1907725 RepID=UPI0025BF2AE1|nr:D-alanyl-D-alanine carboxypeptidase/D-alanyl-D-alanine-endopeptidase [Limnohabitans sp.]